jgi:hypothetical protein
MCNPKALADEIERDGYIEWPANYGSTFSKNPGRNEVEK